MNRHAKRKYNRRYRATHREQIRRQKQTRYKNPSIRTAICASVRAYRKTPRGKASAHKYKQSKKGRETHRAVHLRLKYGLTIAEWDQIFAVQNGVCAMCGQPAANFTQKFHVDHDHSTRLIRGLLCWGCNRLLPCRKNLTNLLKTAIMYLENPPAVKALGGERFANPIKRHKRK